ncbi:MAG: twitching motility protein PilT [Lachnospiraceae bacterium]|nr:twitching motility protein PilT [Lachnospiraceae bacterium]
MIHLIVGTKGKGKTKILIDKANNNVKDVKGSVVYIDQSMRHMYELNNKIRYVNIKEFGIANRDEFIGFFNGIISQNRDTEQIYLDGLLKLDAVESEDISYIIKKLDTICSAHNIDMTISLSAEKEDLEAELQEMVETAL